MFDTMTLTKTAGALCGALLVFLLGSWAAETIYSTGGHGEDRAQGFVIDTGTDEAAQDVAEDTPDLATLFASADASRGERVFNQCRACHQLEDGNNGVGPHLYGVVARAVGSVDGFNYSGALSQVADVWTAEELDAFLENPASYAPGTSMGYAGLSNPEDRVNVIAYLDETDGETNIELAAAETGTASDDAAESAAEGAETEAAAADEAAASEGAAAEEGATDEAATDEAATDEAATDEAATDEAATEDAATAEAATEEVATEEAATEEAATDEAATDEAVADEAASDAAAAEETGREEDATDDAVAGAATAESDASDFAVLVASADVDAGQRLYRQCQACHQLENERNAVGPHLVGIVGRDIASVEGFNYSDALAGLDGAWTLDELSAWIENPSEYAPGNRMGYRGLSDEQDRANLMAYLQSVGN